ncbi:OmpH family outer membrane protein [Tropicimonas sp. S265A]|uniref:OmpH family outer membrane protein n=1 Tax=Tropicimonas sp. S265A TaxID=3415134 RepID=UPI003C7DFC47
MLRRTLLALGLGLAAHALHAQERPRSSVVIIDQERLLSETVFGLRLSEELEAASRALAEENRQIEQMLTDEERLLTEQRPEMTPDVFRDAANAFDARVTELRTEQDRKARIIAERRDAERRSFLDAALPILGGLMADYGAYVILDQRQIFLSDDRVNVTDEAIRRIDDALGARVSPQPRPNRPTDQSPVGMPPDFNADPETPAPDVQLPTPQ